MVDIKRIMTTPQVRAMVYTFIAVILSIIVISLFITKPVESIVFCIIFTITGMIITLIYNMYHWFLDSIKEFEKNNKG